MSITINAHEGATIHIVNGASVCPSCNVMLITASATIDENQILNIGAVSPERYTWKEIDAIGRQGKAARLFGIDAQKTVTLKNGKVAVFRIIGFNHDVDRCGNLIPMSWELVGVLDKRQTMNDKLTNKGGWRDSLMRKYLNKDILELLPNDLKEFIKPTAKKNRISDSKEITETVDMLWLLSEQEKFGREIFSYGDEGEQYKLYKGENAQYHKLDSDGDKRWHWLRSPSAGNTTGFCGVNSDGNAGWGDAGNAGSVSFGLCI